MRGSAAASVWSEVEVQAQGVVELGQQVGGNPASDGADAFHRDRTNLFSLGFRIHVQALSPAMSMGPG